jgi:short-subunit dehydrogenase
MKSYPYLERKVVLVTGGSKGLGFALVREFAQQGSTVITLSRHQEELDEAIARLREESLTVEGQVCDVTKQDEIEALIESTQTKHGPIDVLVNNAGTIQVGPADTMTVEDIKQAMDTMFWGTVYPTLKVLPSMRSRDEGRIVNITSIGGKVSVPHLLPYASAKFAAVGFSEGLQAELGSTGVKIVTVVPGLMRTGSYQNALFHGDTKGEFRWFSLSSSAPLLTISGESAARRIVKATVKGERELILSLPANVLARTKGLFPGTTQHVLTLSQRFLPSSDGQSETRTGTEVKRDGTSKLQHSAMVLGRRAADRLQPSRNR